MMFLKHHTIQSLLYFNKSKIISLGYLIMKEIRFDNHIWSSSLLLSSSPLSSSASRHCPIALGHNHVPVSMSVCTLMTSPNSSFVVVIFIILVIRLCQNTLLFLFLGRLLLLIFQKAQLCGNLSTVQKTYMHVYTDFLDHGPCFGWGSSNSCQLENWKHQIAY